MSEIAPVTLPHLRMCGFSIRRMSPAAHDSAARLEGSSHPISRTLLSVERFADFQHRLSRSRIFQPAPTGYTLCVLIIFGFRC